MAEIRNINEGWQSEQTQRDGLWQYRELSGEKLGVRIERIEPGGTSSVHHFHTVEEEHVLIMSGNLTLVLGGDEQVLEEGDHVWFAGGEPTAHHLRNDTKETAQILVFGERCQEDVVVYPENKVMLIKALDRQLVTYRPFQLDQT